jgi:hypothetical protein
MLSRAASFLSFILSGPRHTSAAMQQYDSPSQTAIHSVFNALSRAAAEFGDETRFVREKLALVTTGERRLKFSFGVQSSRLLYDQVATMARNVLRDDSRLGARVSVGASPSIARA